MPSTQPCPKCSAPVPVDSRFCQNCGANTSGAGGKSGPARVSAAGGSQTRLFIVGALAIALVVVAVLGGMAFFSGKGTALPEGGIAGAGPLPDWLQNADPDIIADYAWAAEHHEELQYIPCYCGCGSVGHTSNATCYYRWDKNGKILGYDSHALG
ncbi:MAG TPA: PCYCGC motif-containing (lipo)protein [Symbiobacteriaceae bacterium]|nr:PCYCGC motif-containing (lipo)protein [Symbiobacteriaceae bacterium]